MLNAHDAVSTEGPTSPIASAPEFKELCAHLDLFVRDGAEAERIRSAVHLFAEAARLHRWTPEAILKALHSTSCYPLSVGGATNRQMSKRYSQAIDLLLYDYFNVYA